jgi:molecular chaperone DnaJ
MLSRVLLVLLSRKYLGTFDICFHLPYNWSVASKSFYDILGLSRSASDKEIKQAYRKLARKLHPDVNPGDKRAEERFKQVNAAFEVLSDPEKRSKYDRYGEQWEQAEAFERARQAGGSAGFTQGFDLGDLFGRGGGGSPFNTIFESFRGRRGPSRGQNVEYAAEVTLEEASQGTTRLLQLQSEQPCDTCGGTGQVAGAVCHVCQGAGTALRSKRLEVKIPAGVRDGSRVRIAREGRPGAGGGPRGDLYVVTRVRPHSNFQRKGDDLTSDVAVSVEDAVLGAEAEVLTLSGKKVALKIPPLTQNDRVFRLSGLGMPHLDGKRKGRGDLLARVRVVLPEKLSDRERELFEQLREERRKQKVGAK